ncbi:complement C1q-like protein 2 [Engraulis encrasicolus]|uniref:complement C1q-like protein 2 n=1 Tax=Engraulis encrasicolus TaxID=184585 RepID=UPI002FD2E017
MRAAWQIYGKQLHDTKNELSKVKAEVVELKAKQEKGMIAFSGALPNGIRDEAHLRYTRLFTNVGNAYNSTTGDFTAPVKGVYFFTFVILASNSRNSGAILTRNGDVVLTSHDLKGSGDPTDTTTNSVVLQLEAGENISMQQWLGSRLYETNNKHNTFSGFLLFAL